MRHLKAQYGLTHLDAGEGTLDACSHVLGKHLHSGQVGIAQVEEVIHLLLRDDQCMSLNQRIDIEESEELVVFGYFVAGNLACYDFTENGCHMDRN